MNFNRIYVYVAEMIHKDENKHTPKNELGLPIWRKFFSFVKGEKIVR